MELGCHVLPLMWSVLYNVGPPVFSSLLFSSLIFSFLFSFLFFFFPFSLPLLLSHKLFQDLVKINAQKQALPLSRGFCSAREERSQQCV